MSHALPEPLLQLIIRFTASIPDLTLLISSPQTTSTLTLKQLIRPHLPPTYLTSRLRLIYAGKVLTDNASLSKSLNLPPPPPGPQPHAKLPKVLSSKGKGKEKEISKDADTRQGRPPPPPRRIYIHCSIGDTLTPSILSAEATSAASADEALAAALNKTISRSPDVTTSGFSEESTTRPAPLGFDRLLQTGFTAAEVAALRSQYLSILSNTHTPETMPQGAALRALEDRWLDSDNASPPHAGALGAADGDGDWGDGGGLDDTFWGNLIGFFWPLGAVVWGCREEGVWTRRRQYAVLSGVGLNLIIGFIAWLN
ncbi:hypothetical protein K402DRAFT_391220 [Aulographum hederae CBS 113979]|uniref:Ubiquitin-like domain-containing protein n=1 Tax=Aulographum hederae CBS 113979 TaxID=1176131 RepID=A0A6G1H7N6_9PEZI|nr:hypothetical protein K402DRAFT_391220 [Aulographum hederae CBS 113979]